MGINSESGHLEIVLALVLPAKFSAYLEVALVKKIQSLHTRLS
jgi:hypothetical protein